MDHPQGVLRTGDRATVTFEFISHPEFIKEGMKLLFREGKTKVHVSCLPLYRVSNSPTGPRCDHTVIVRRVGAVCLVFLQGYLETSHCPECRE